MDGARRRSLDDAARRRCETTLQDDTARRSKDRRLAASRLGKFGEVNNDVQGPGERP